METRELLDALGYGDSPNCLTGSELKHAPDYGHVFRRATEGAGLEAVYCLRPPASGSDHLDDVIPVSYVCKADSFEHADAIHQLVWNQSVAPFLIVLAPQGVRVYTGFERREDASNRQHLLESDLADVASRLDAVSSASIDSGSVWDRLGDQARPQGRVEWRLLADLERLEKILAEEGLRESSLVHTLIGKLLYLHYLRHRNILSDARLGKWDLTWPEVASRTARMKAFSRLCTHLDEWLNGSVFPLTKQEMSDIGTDHLQRAAGVFAGDSPEGQQHLAFDAYNFSYIPIETLSVVYEQFLHLRPTPSGPSVGRKRGAYYTPIPVVNFIIDRLDEVKPLRSGMRVLDPACGSGAFLVQCYRKLIEDRLRTFPSQKLRPPELRELLVKHIFGIDVDTEACKVAELSLLLTMLDYIDPPDLTNTKFNLPDLSGANIIEANAFDEKHEFIARAKVHGFDWVIGNPPWNELAGNTKDPIEKPMLDWMVDHSDDKPTGGNQTAELFAWRACELARRDGLVGFLVPAMVLFKAESQAFRERFFSVTQLVYAANFANLKRVLFSGRSHVPSAALILRANRTADDRRVAVFSPLIANQEVMRPRVQGARMETWSIVIDENELRFVDIGDFSSGHSFVWRMAAWGSDLDRSILRRADSLRSLGDFADEQNLAIAEGMQLRENTQENRDKTNYHPELAGKLTIDLTALARQRRLFAFPNGALVTIPSDGSYVRVRGGFAAPEIVSRPPHILVNAARNWAIYSDEYIVVPARQIGIAGAIEKVTLLKALTLYLNSQFVQYHQFFGSTQSGVSREVSTLRTLRSLPVPDCLTESDNSVIKAWAALHDQLAVHDGASTGSKLNERRKLELLTKLNVAVNAALRLREQDRVRISDFVEILLGLSDGKTDERAIRPPVEAELRMYAERLQLELDAFVGAEADVGHNINIWSDDRQGVIRIDLLAGNGIVTVHQRSHAVDVVRQVADLRDRLEKRFSQWRYFNRNLRVFSDDRLYLVKPMQHFHWVESQAIQDANEVVGLVLHRVAPIA